MRTTLISLAAAILVACNYIFPPAPPPTATPTVDELALYRQNLTPSHKQDLDKLDRPTRYELDLKYDPLTATLTGIESVNYYNRESAPLGEIYFRLFANYPEYGGSVEVSNLSINNIGVDGKLESEGTALKIPLSQPLAPGSSLQVKLEFKVQVPRKGGHHYEDFVVGDYVTTMPTVYPLIPAYDSKGWHTEVPPPYGDLVYADISLYSVRITLPSDYTVIASGSTVDKKGNADGTTTWHIVGAPVRDFDINVTNKLQKASQTVGETTVNSWYEPSDSTSGNLALKYAVDSLNDYIKRFGDYPYTELDVVETPTTAGGIEYPGIVAIGKSLYSQRNRTYFEFATVHEVAHQWWYGIVGDDQVNYPWVDEAMAQYSSLVYNEDVHGQSASSSVLKDYFQTLFENAKRSGRDAAVNQPVSAFNEDDYGAIVYGKGPLFFDAIRKEMGDDDFFQFFRNYYQQFKYGIAFPEDIFNTAQSTCSCSLQEEYDQWILSPKK